VEAPSTVGTGFEAKAAAFHGGQERCVEPKDAIALLHEATDLVWIDILAVDVEATKKLLEDELHFHALAVEDALSEYERPTLQQFDGHVFFSIPTLEGSKADPQFVEVGFFLLRHGLVTVSTKECKLLTEWFERWKSHPQAIGSSAAMLTHSVVDGIVDEYFPLVEELEEELDQLADKIFSGDTKQVKELLVLKRKLLEVRRRIGPVREILNGLLRRDTVLIPEKARLYFQDVYDHITRISELVDINRDTLASLLDVHLSQVSNNLNEVVKKMTVVATVLMIMSLVAGIYGMNFDKMPELHWAIGYPVALGTMVALGGATIWVFKRIDWL
jgi:magnesium transporter